MGKLTSHEIVYVKNDSGDWCGIYVDNELQTQGHSIPYFTWIDLINTFWNFNQALCYEISDSYLESIGDLPNKFSDIPTLEIIG